MPFFKSSRGLNWHYDISGQGEAVLFIHGFSGSGGWWVLQKDFLKQDFQVIAVDLPGHGESAWMPLTLGEMAQDIKQLLSAIHVPHVSIVSSSLGGLLAIELHRIMSESIMRMSFVGALPKFARSDSYPAGLDVERIRKLSGQFDGDYMSILDIFFRSLFTMKERDSEQFQWVKQMRAAQRFPQREALKHFLDILERADLRDRIAKMICPLQFICGSEDYICPRSVMDWMAEHTYNARFDFVEHCGHLPFLTQTKEYNRLLEDFLIN